MENSETPPVPKPVSTPISTETNSADAIIKRAAEIQQKVNKKNPSWNIIESMKSETPLTKPAGKIINSSE